MSMRPAGEGGVYGACQTVIESGDTITAAGQFASNLTLPPNTFTPGAVLRITAQGTYTTTATLSPLFNLSLQNTPAGGAAADLVPANATNSTLAVSQTNAGWGADFYIICTTGGNFSVVNGTVEAQGKIWSATAAGAMTFLQNANSAPITLNTQVKQTLALKITPTLVAGQSFTLRLLIIEVL